MGDDLTIRVNGKPFHVSVIERSRQAVRFSVDGRTYLVDFEDPVAAPKAQQLPSSGLPDSVSRPKIPAGRRQADRRTAPGQVQISAPIPGVVTAVLVEPGSAVSAGTPLLRIEAMKMENSINSTATGRVELVLVAIGDEVCDGQPLVLISV